MPLSDVAIRRCKLNKTPQKLSDGGGLYLLIQPSGTKLWRYKYRFAGKEKLLALGSYPETSLAEAREKHLAARKLLSSGKDPSQAKQEARRQLILDQSDTFEAVAREWHANQSGRWAPSHAKKILRQLELDAFPKLGGRAIKELSPSEILEVVRKVEKREAHDSAHRLLRNINQVCCFAVVTNRLTRSPAIELKGALKPVRRNNNAYLREEELPEFFEKLRNYDGERTTQFGLQLLALLFVRTKELRGAAWKEISFDKELWRIPAERMKTKSPHIVPLSKQAIATLKELQGITGHRELLFPNRTQPSKCISENTMLYALYRMGYHSRATGHGFRATASTILNENGFSPDIIERQLAHAERNEVRAAYNHAQYLPQRRQMMQWWADYLDKAATPKN